MRTAQARRELIPMFVTIKKSLFVLSTLLLAGGCDTADDDSATRVREVVTGAEVSLVQAIDAAVAAVPAGVVIEAELEVEAATPIYEVRMLADDTLTKIHVDPATGEVLRSEVDDDADDVAEAVAAAGVLQTAALDAAAVIAIAPDQRPRGGAFGVEVKDGQLEVEVVDDEGLFEIRINPADGSVSEVDASDDDHGGGDDDGDDGDDGDGDHNDGAADGGGGDDNDGAADDGGADSPDDNGGADEPGDDNGGDTA